MLERTLHTSYICIRTILVGLFAYLYIKFFKWTSKSKQDSEKIESIKGIEAIFEDLDCKIGIDVPLSTHNRFRVGGSAQFLFQPNNLTPLVKFLQRRPKNLVITVIGMGSNVLIRDQGISGVVIKLGKSFQQLCNINWDEELIEVGAGMSQGRFSRLCKKNGIGGLEFFCGIPGTIGGAIRMNAGIRDVEVKDVLYKASFVEVNTGRIITVPVSSLNFNYRECGFLLSNNYICVSATFKGMFGTSSALISSKIHKMLKTREESQPVNEMTAGCTFRNPTGKLAWELIEASGCKGLSIGDAQVSRKHANFIINMNNASSKDIEQLANTVFKKVYEKFNIKLKWEIIRLGY